MGATLEWTASAGCITVRVDLCRGCHLDLEKWLERAIISAPEGDPEPSPLDAIAAAANAETKAALRRMGEDTRETIDACCALYNNPSARPEPRWRPCSTIWLVHRLRACEKLGRFGARCAP